ncbi:hypothetical protein ANN_22081 [Periplaneta americana]|uniref:Uncharacterized protein n=1 Tax=Periplaneta americana TaxID=6978 RepID=A0ABQ8S839_PERAM|nr:hypothetical protein ANN_22081 [Periplaneta americana]
MVYSSTYSGFPNGALHLFVNRVSGKMHRSSLSANDDSGYNCSANDRSAFCRYKTASIDYSRICNRKRISEKSRYIKINNIRASEKINTFASAHISQFRFLDSRLDDKSFSTE